LFNDPFFKLHLAIIAKNASQARFLDPLAWLACAEVLAPDSAYAPDGFKAAARPVLPQTLNVELASFFLSSSAVINDFLIGRS